jgi:hypothetical protein
MKRELRSFANVELLLPNGDDGAIIDIPNDVAFVIPDLSNGHTTAAHTHTHMSIACISISVGLAYQRTVIGIIET